jgi:uncharacterized protein RhaS with RHS repeats
VVHRYYDPATGQFLTVDPKVADTEVAYAYGGDDPTDNVDLNGLERVVKCMSKKITDRIGCRPPFAPSPSVQAALSSQDSGTLDVQLNNVGSGIFLSNSSANSKSGSGRLAALLSKIPEVDLDALSASGRDLVKNGLTRSGRAYQKHMGRGELEKVLGKELNSAGQDLLDEILTNPGTARSTVTTGNFSGGLRFINPDGIGATFDSTGTFQYFGIYP